MPRKSLVDPMPHDSWAGAMQAYVNEKSHSAPAVEPMHRFVRNDGTARKRAQRDYNIVTCSEADPALTASRQARAAQEAADHVTRATERSLKKGYHCYDVVTMQPRYGVDETTVSAIGGNQEPRGKRIHPPEPFVSYDIVTNQAVAGREHIKDDARPRKEPSKNRPVRATNVLNHQYTEDNDNKVRAEEQAVQQRIARAVDNGRAFNPITQQFNDASREITERRAKCDSEEQRRELVRTHTYNTSGIVKRSEGHAFDIVTNHVYNPDMVLALDRRDATGVPQRAALRQQWEQRRDVEEAIRDADVDRALRRVAKERLQDSVSHGYDVLSNQPFVQVDQADTKTKPHLLSLTETLRQPSAIERLGQTLQPKPITTTTVVREDGPRTTSERLFNSIDSRTAGAASFSGRQQLVLPTLEKVKSRAPDTGSAFTATR
jgi:hypothetical protein